MSKIRVIPNSAATQIIDQLLQERNDIDEVVAIVLRKNGAAEIFSSSDSVCETVGVMEVLKQQLLLQVAHDVVEGGE